MPLRSGLSVYIWVGPPNFGSPVVQEIGSLLDQVSMTKVSPGGFGEFKALVRIRSAKVQRPQFGLFSRLAIMDGPTPVFLGELTGPAYGLSQMDGEYIRLDALGLGNALRDNPGNYSYAAQTPQQIAQAQLTQHTATQHDLAAVISTDNTQLFPDNPITSITQIYSGRTMEEILADAALLAGDYDWGTEADPLQKDTAGFPLGRVFVRKRTLTLTPTTDYTASLAQNDILAAEFTPTAARAYNQIEIDYNAGTAGLGSAVQTDTRLNVDLSQGSAPFRFRRYQRDLSGTGTVNSTIASAIATTQLALFENVTYSGTATLQAIRDGNGARMPLWQAQAGRNLFVPEMAIQGQQLPSSPTQNVNLFWITQTTYREDSLGNQQLDMNLGYIPDLAGVQIARLQMAADAISRSGQVVTQYAAKGSPMHGQYAISFSNGVAGQTVGDPVQFPLLAYQVPTSLTLSSIATSNMSALSVTDFTAVGAFVYGTVSANGAGYARGTFTTVGNCFLQVDGEGATGGRFAHHCDVCDTVHQDLALDERAPHLFVCRIENHLGLSVLCPSCAAHGVATTEAFNLALMERDESDADPQRGLQARLIRQAMRALGITLR